MVQGSRRTIFLTLVRFSSEVFYLIIHWFTLKKYYLLMLFKYINLPIVALSYFCHRSVGAHILRVESAIAPCDMSNNLEDLSAFADDTYA